MRFPDRLGLLDRAERYPGFLPLRPVVANGTGALERSGRELWAITAHTLDRLPHGRFCVDLTMFADRPRILERFAVRYGKYLKGDRTALDVCFASMFVRQVRQCFSAVWADGFPRCRHRFPVM